MSDSGSHEKLVEEIALEVMKHSSIAAVWQSLEKIHKQQLYIIENQRKLAAQMDLKLER